MGVFRKMCDQEELDVEKKVFEEGRQSCHATIVNIGGVLDDLGEGGEL